MDEAGEARELREVSPGGEGGEVSPEEAPEAPAAPEARANEPERFWNVPNTITMVRIGVVPVFVMMPFLLSKAGSQFMAWLFIVAALSDLVDGWIARSWKQITKVGKLLDPLADKLIVSTALIMLLAVGRLERWTAIFTRSSGIL